MKSKALEITMQVWAYSLVLITAAALIFSIYKLVRGEYSSTASFQF